MGIASWFRFWRLHKDVRELSRLNELNIRGGQRFPQMYVYIHHLLFKKGIEARKDTIAINIPYDENDFKFSYRLLEYLKANLLDQHGLYLRQFDSTHWVIYNEAGIVGMLEIAVKTVAASFKVLGPEGIVGAVEDILETSPLNQRVHVVKRVIVNPVDGTLKATSEVLNHSRRSINHRVLYPWLDTTPADMWEAFNNSDSNVLFIIGQPGTGKSSFITEMIRARKENGKVFVADSENVLQSPHFVDYIRSSPRQSLFITEDSDNFVASRESGNSQMSALLNTFSGVIPADTKIIISTNLPNLKRVDPALLRPGRTFRVLEFKTLTHAQALAVREELGLPHLPVLSEDPDREYTLAEAINWHDHPVEALRPKDFGFGFTG